MRYILEGIFLGILSLLLLLFFANDPVTGWICDTGFLGAIGLVVYGVGKQRSAARFSRYLQSIDPHADEMKTRLEAGESVDAIAQDFKARYAVPERAATLLGLFVVRGWLKSDDPQMQRLGRRFVEAQSVESRQPPEVVLNQLSEEGIAIYLDESAVCGINSPALRWDIDKKRVSRDVPAGSGDLLLTTSYLFFLSHVSDQKGGQLSRSLQMLIALVLFPATVAASITLSVLSLLPGFSQATEVAAGLGALYIKPFSPRKIRKLKRAFRNSRSFAIPLSGIVGCAPAGGAIPQLLISYFDRDGTFQQRWFWSTNVKQEADRNDFRPEEAKAEDTPKGWLASWVNRISLVALGEGKVLKDEVPEPATAEVSAKPRDIWNRGRPGPFDADKLAKMRSQNTFTKLLIAFLVAVPAWCISFAVAVLPFIGFGNFVDSARGSDPPIVAVVLGMAVALLLGALALVGPFWFAGKVTGLVMNKLFPAADPSDPDLRWAASFNSWEEGPEALLGKDVQQSVETLVQPGGLDALVERYRDRYRTPAIYTRMAVLELLCGMAQSGFSATRSWAGELVASLSVEPCPDAGTAVGQLSTSENVYFIATSMRLGSPELGPGAAAPALMLVGTCYLFFVPLKGEAPPSGLGTCSLSPQERAWLQEMFAKNGGTAIRLSEVCKIDLSPAARFDDGARQSVATQITLEGADGSDARAYRVWMGERDVRRKDSWFSSKESANAGAEKELKDLAVLWMARLQVATAGARNLLVWDGTRLIRFEDAYPQSANDAAASRFSSAA